MFRGPSAIPRVGMRGSDSFLNAWVLECPSGCKCEGGVACGGWWRVGDKKTLVAPRSGRRRGAALDVDASAARLERTVTAPPSESDTPQHVLHNATFV